MVHSSLRMASNIQLFAAYYMKVTALSVSCSYICSGDTVRSVFRSSLYLFAEQPYSVGDYLDIDGELW
jgi:hypothetical protein